MEKRVEQRRKLDVPMKAFGMDAMGKPFIETVRALSISIGGIHLAGLKARNRTGEVIGIQYNGAKVRATVIWVGPPGSPMDGHIGVRVVDRDAAIWRAVQPALQSSEPKTPASGNPAKDRRRAKRFACHASAKFRVLGVGNPVWAVVTDLSLTGCYVETVSPALPSKILEMSVELEGHTVNVLGEVRCSDPGFGMGVSFAQMAEDDRQRLEVLLNKLASRVGISLPD